MTRYTGTVLLLVFATFPFPPGAAAQQPDRWVSVGTEAGAEVALDTASVTEIDPDVVEAWLRQDLSESRTFLVDRYDSRLLLHRYDCRLRRQRLIWFRLHDGDRLVRERRPAESRWHPVSPGSVEESVWRRVCGEGS